MLQFQHLCSSFRIYLQLEPFIIMSLSTQLQQRDDEEEEVGKITTRTIRKGNANNNVQTVEFSLTGFFF